jgi:hypothetical protein
MEYIIWGQTNPQEYEKILCTKVENELITDKTQVEKIAYLLKVKYNCINIRIQEIDLSYPQSLNKFFIESIN